MALLFWSLCFVRWFLHHWTTVWCFGDSSPPTQKPTGAPSSIQNISQIHPKCPTITGTQVTPAQSWTSSSLAREAWLLLQQEIPQLDSGCLISRETHRCFITFSSHCHANNNVRVIIMEFSGAQSRSRSGGGAKCPVQSWQPEVAHSLRW